MSDLISRSETYKDLIGRIDWLREQDYELYCAIGDCIQDSLCKMTTAYDVDNVVEEIMEAYGCHNCEQCDTMACNECAELEVLKDICEIVKHGGVYDDVCEWKYVRDGEYIQNPHTKRLYSNEPSMKNIYCNTCGKEIKVVE